MRVVSQIQDYELPQVLAVCPYCGAKLRATSTGGDWDEKAEAWIPVMFDLTSDCEPSVESPDWDDWWSNHSLYSFMEWVPITTAVEKYMAMNFRVTD